VPGANTEVDVIVLGVVLLIIGLVANIAILTTLGIIAIVIGLILTLIGATGRAVGGRRYWY
jgi:membrane-bound ClpP family serine protease